MISHTINESAPVMLIQLRARISSSNVRLSQGCVTGPLDYCNQIRKVENE